MSVVNLMMPMAAIGYIVFVFVAESLNPFRVPTAKRGVPGYTMRYSRYRWGLMVGSLIILSPVFTAVFPSDGTSNRIVYSLQFVLAALLCLVCFYGVKQLILMAREKRNPSIGTGSSFGADSSGLSRLPNSGTPRLEEPDCPNIVINADTRSAPKSRDGQLPHHSRIRRGVFKPPAKTNTELGLTS